MNKISKGSAFDLVNYESVVTWVPKGRVPEAQASRSASLTRQRSLKSADPDTRWAASGTVPGMGQGDTRKAGVIRKPSQLG